MANKIAPLLPSTDQLLYQLGARLRMARLRRRLPAKQVAQRAGMSPMTLRSLERGGSGVTVGAYVAVMQVLGIEKDLDLLAKADPVGRELQDSRLPAHGRSPPGRPFGQARERTNPAIKEISKQLKPAESSGDWLKKSGFASASNLATLIKPPAPPPKKRR